MVAGASQAAGASGGQLLMSAGNADTGGTAAVCGGCGAQGSSGMVKIAAGCGPAGGNLHFVAGNSIDSPSRGGCVAVDAGFSGRGAGGDVTVISGGSRAQQSGKVSISSAAG